MRFMVLVKASPESEAGVLPTPELLLEMGKFNEGLVKAGVMLAGDGLQASSKGARLKFSGGKATVIDGPFAETKIASLGVVYDPASSVGLKAATVAIGEGCFCEAIFYERNHDGQSQYRTCRAC